MSLANNKMSVCGEGKTEMERGCVPSCVLDFYT